MIDITPLLVDTKTACALLGIGRTKLFESFNLPPSEGGLQRVKIGSKTLVPMANIKALAEKGAA